MVTSLLTSLVLAITLTPALAQWLTRAPQSKGVSRHSDEGPLLRSIGSVYEAALRAALRYRWATIVLCLTVLLASAVIYTRLDSEFLPPMDEGGFVIDYRTPPGTSLSETNRQLLQAEQVLRSIPEVESYSRRTGARLALAIAEPNTGDFLVKLRTDRRRSTEQIISTLRAKLTGILPGVNFEFPGILSDLIGDLMWAPKPIEIKFYSTDVNALKTEGPKIQGILRKVPGVVDTFDGLVYAGTSLRLSVRQVEAQRLGFTSEDIASAVNTAML
jgi:Cu/Ag efflux pump CusA